MSELKSYASEIIKQGSGGDLLGSLLTYLAYEYGPQYARDLWNKSKCRWQQFVNNNVEEFIEKYVSLT